jgi:hypothetical protein
MSLGPLVRQGWVECETNNSQRTSRQFLASYESVIGEVGAYAGPENYSVVVVGPLPDGPRKGHIAITGIAQIVSRPASLASKGEATATGSLQWARLWTQEGYFEYAWVSTGDSTKSVSWKPKAAQYWLRVDDARRIYEPGPALCWFPDPVPMSEASVGISRFSYVF